MPSTRRSILIGSSVAIGAIAGCQSVNLGDPREIDLTLRNYTDKEQPLRLELLREDKTELGEASVLDTEYTVPAPGEGDDSAGTIRETDVVPERRYIVRVLLKNGRHEQFHSHYYPDGSTDDEIDISIYRDETTENLFVDFRAIS
ncbi:hypothetical protein [Halorubrum trapanicum]|uniref:hypothetical protein n=1 Tax=Halorubrum trapanicum TaxID=29284 RepID=UPI0012FD24C8|nr:hypothetical protein [Halorubrum trapanicum]